MVPGVGGTLVLADSPAVTARSWAPGGRGEPGSGPTEGEVIRSGAGDRKRRAAVTSESAPALGPLGLSLLSPSDPRSHLLLSSHFLIQHPEPQTEVVILKCLSSCQLLCNRRAKTTFPPSTVA